MGSVKEWSGLYYSETDDWMMPTLYRHLGLAVALSPRLDALLAETAYRSQYLAERTSLIHAGARTPGKETRLLEAIDRSGLPGGTQIHWATGDPDTAILDLALSQGMDLIMAGALEKEQALRYYLGSIARNLARESPCSVLLLTEPRTDPQPFHRIVVITDFSEQSLISLSRAIRLAERENAEQVTVIRVLSDYGTAMVFSDGVRREHADAYRVTSHAKEQDLLANFVDAVGRRRVPVEALCIEGHTGFAAATYARENDADLLVIPSSNRHSHFFERLFPSDMEWVLREIPCNLLVVRERVG